jgi:hypothetical protein
MKTNVIGYKIYKPSKAMTGAAIQFNPAEDMSCIFLEIAPQIKSETAGDDFKSFDWEKKIVMKLGDNDMLSLYNVFEVVRSYEYKKNLLSSPDQFDTINKQWADKNKGNLLSLFHLDKNKGTSSSLNVKPNTAQYGGGFLVNITKQYTKESTVSYRINLSPVEVQGILFLFEKILIRR